MDPECHLIYAHLSHYSQFYEQIRDSKLLSTMEGEGVDCSSRGPDDYTVPIVGHEIVEPRERFTVYKLHVQKQERNWFIFRRYSDFERLNEKLMSAFPQLTLKLPPKRRFGGNFNPEFIARREQGLQKYITTIIQHREMCICRITQEFFCLHDPPGPFDSLEESRAYVQHLEEQMEDRNSLVRQLTSQLEATKSRLGKATNQIQNLKHTLRKEQLQRKTPDQPAHSTPAISDDCAPMEVPLSGISDSCLKTKSRKSVSFSRTKAASEGNLLLLKNNKEQLPFVKLQDQTRFRHSITFGEGFFFYSGFLDVEMHSNVTDKTKERKQKSRRKAGSRPNRCKQNSSDDILPSHKQLRETRSADNTHSRISVPKDSWKKEKRDSGIIGDSFTNSDFY